MAFDAINVTLNYCCHQCNFLQYLFSFFTLSILLYLFLFSDYYNISFYFLITILLLRYNFITLQLLVVCD